MHSYHNKVNVESWLHNVTLCAGRKKDGVGEWEDQAVETPKKRIGRSVKLQLSHF